MSSSRLAFAGLLALGFVALAAPDVAAGVAAFSILALLEQVPPVAGSPGIKLAGAVLVIMEGGGRFGGAVGNPNELASTLVPALALGGFVLATGRSRISQAMIGVSLIAIVYALVLTGSRGGLVALAVSLSMAVILGGALRMRILAVVAVAAGLGVVYYGFIAPPAMRSGLQTSLQRVVRVGSTSGPCRRWSRPALGVGADNFPIVEPSSRRAKVCS